MARAPPPRTEDQTVGAVLACGSSGERRGPARRPLALCVENAQSSGVPMDPTACLPAWPTTVRTTANHRKTVSMAAADMSPQGQRPRLHSALGWAPSQFAHLCNHDTFAARKDAHLP
jgi:hypothetical protein